MKIKEEYVDKIYPPCVKYILQNSIKKLGYNFSNKLGKEKIRTMIFQLPITRDGLIDIEQQKEIANVYKKAYSIKKELVDNLRVISEVTVSM